MKRGEVLTGIFASAVAAVFILTGAARLPIAPEFSFPILGFNPGTAADSAAIDSVATDIAAGDSIARDSIARDSVASDSAPNAAVTASIDTSAPTPRITIGDTANLYHHPPVLVYSERMIEPLLVRAKRPEPKPFFHAGAAIDRELAHAKNVLFRKEFPTLSHLPKSVERARELVMNARAGKKVPVSLTRYCLNGTTRRDHEVREGIVAADPRLFKLGHYVDLYLGGKKLGRFLIDDTGGNVKGATLDIWTPSCSEARRFGRQRGAAMLVAKPESTP